MSASGRMSLLHCKGQGMTEKQEFGLGYLFSNLYLLYLSEKHWDRRSQKYSTYHFIGSDIMLGQIEGRVQEHSLGLPLGWQKSKYLNSYFLPARVYISKILGYREELGSKLDTLRWDAAIQSNVLTAAPITPFLNMLNLRCQLYHQLEIWFTQRVWNSGDIWLVL